MDTFGAGIGSLFMIIGYCIIGQLYLSGYPTWVLIVGLIINVVVGVFISSWSDKPLK